MRPCLHLSWGLLKISGGIAILASALAVRSLSQDAAPVSSPAGATASGQAEVAGFPVTVTTRDLQVRVNGWDWRTLRTARLKFDLTKNGKALQPDATKYYETTITDSAGKVVSEAPEHLEKGPWHVRLEFSIQPEERQPEWALGRVRVPGAQKAAILRVPAKFKERGIIFAAVVGDGFHSFRDGRRIDAKSLKPEERWAATEKDWTASWQVNEPSFVWVREVPRNLQGWQSISFRGYAGSQRIPLFQVYPQGGGCGMMDRRPRTARGELEREAYPLQERAGEWVTIEGFDVKSGYEVEFTVLPPKPNPEAGKELVIREYWIPYELFEILRNKPASTADHHHAALHPVGLGGSDGGRLSMYSPASHTLVIRDSEEAIARTLDAIELATGFRPSAGLKLYDLFWVCAQAPYQPFPLRWEIADALQQHITAKVIAAAKRKR